MNWLRSEWMAILGRRGLPVGALALLIGTMCFFMVRSLPGDMAMRVAASRYGYDMVGSAAAAAVMAELGLDRPLLAALLAWWGDIVRLDLGVSLVSGRPVWTEVAHQLGATIDLGVAAVFLACLMGVPLGLWAGLHTGGLVDRLTLGLAVVFRAIPPFLLSVLLMLVVAVWWGVLPVAGEHEHGGLMLPALTLALGLAAGLARVVRNAMREVVLSAHYEFARTKGLSDLQALLRHGLRNAAVPVIAYLGVQTVFLLEGALVVETLFAWPGIAHAMTHAVFGRDVPMIQGTALCMGVMFVVFNLLIDAATLLIDPRQRLAAAGKKVRA